MVDLSCVFVRSAQFRAWRCGYSVRVRVRVCVAGRDTEGLH